MELAGKLILSFYIDSRDVNSEELVQYVDSVKKQFSSLDDSSVAMFFIPIKGESRIECVNPVLVTEEAAIENFNKSVGTLNELISKFKGKEDEQKSE